MQNHVPTIVFVRHGEPRRGEADPELTSAGHRMAAETAAWIIGLKLPLARVIHTPTQRTRQTAEAVAEAAGLPLGTTGAEPLGDEAWEELLSSQRPPPRFGDRSLPRAAAPPFVYVGHDTTLAYLLRRFARSAPEGLQARAWAAGLALRKIDDQWQIFDGWPGVAQP